MLFSMKTIFAARVSVWVILMAAVAVPGWTVEKILQNDSFSGVGTAYCVLPQSFQVGEIAAARFTPEPSDYPFQILEVQVLVCPDSAQQVIILNVWLDDGVSDQPGDNIHAEAFTLTGSDDALNGLDVSSQGLVVNSGSIRIGFEYDPFFPPQAGFARDTDGHVLPQPNFIYGLPDPPYGWRPADYYGMNHDWIIRVRIDANGAQSIFADGFESGDTSAWSVTVP
jgi:hypothetical protein